MERLSLETVKPFAGNRHRDLVGRLMFANMTLPLGKNCVYGQEKLLGEVLYMCSLRASTEGVQDLRENGAEVPCSSDLRYHLGKFQEVKDVRAFFESAFPAVRAKAINILDGKALTLAIDPTYTPYYGKKRGVFVVGHKRDRGTNWAHEFVSVVIVDKPLSGFTLAVEPACCFSRLEEMLASLLQKVREAGVSTRLLLVDRGFFTSSCINALEAQNTAFLMPAIMNDRMKQLALEYACGNKLPAVVEGYVFGKEKAKVNLLFIRAKDDPDKILAFATNIPPEEIQKAIDRLPEEYRKRWGIETSFRVIKNDFLPKTCSRRYLLRLFYFLFASLLYDLWLLCNAVPEFIGLFRGKRLTSCQARLHHILAAAGPPRPQVVYDPRRFLLGRAAW